MESYNNILKTSIGIGNPDVFALQKGTLFLHVFYMSLGYEWGSFRLGQILPWGMENRCTFMLLLLTLDDTLDDNIQ